MRFRILFQDSYFVAIQKPAGFFVHPPEGQLRPEGAPDRFQRRIPKRVNSLAILRDQLGQYVYPVHRLDRPTSGVLLFALDPETASLLCGMFARGEITKHYLTVTRGYLAERGTVGSPLKSDSSEQMLDAITEYERLAQVELPHAVGRYPTARFSLARVNPKTGRYHQIRRHLDRIAHPVIGDSMHGDTRQNAFFRETVGIDGLLLKADCLQFRHPRTGEELTLKCRDDGRWVPVLDLFKISRPEIDSRYFSNSGSSGC